MFLYADNKVKNDKFCANLLGQFPPHDVPFLKDEFLYNLNYFRTLAIILAYEGSLFSGWQFQPNIFTIQGILEEVLSQLCNHSLCIYGSGRTDSGVHALGQTASFITSSRLSLKKILNGLRALLPIQIFVREIGVVPIWFHARYCVQAKTYCYYFWPMVGSKLFLYKRLWGIPYALDIEAIRMVLTLLPGERNFKVFASRISQNFNVSSSRHNIYSAKLSFSAGGIYCIRLTGSGFLRHVIRNLIGALIQVGCGQLAPEDILEAFKTGRRYYVKIKAPSYGLYLNCIYYSNILEKLIL